jgi:hypothetical protein
VARIRSIKPELRTSKLVASWPREVRYFFALLWGYLDDKGRGLDVPKAIAGDCFPYDDDITPSKVDKWLNLMTRGRNGRPGPVCRYEVDGVRYLHCNFREHQRINRPTPSRLPPCPLHDRLTEPLSEPDSEPPPESLSEGPLSDSLPGFRSSVVRSRGAGEQWSSNAPGVSPGVSGPTAADAKRLVQRIIGPEFPAPARTSLAIHAAELLKQFDLDTVGEALTEWRGRTGIGPGILPSLVADVVKRRNGHTRRAPDKPSTTDARMASIQALKHPEQPALPAGPTP